MRLTMDLPKVSRTQKYSDGGGYDVRVAGWSGYGGGDVV